MAFDVAGDSYDRFMGRFSRPLAPVFADFAGVEAGMEALDVGAGSGNLARELAARLGGEHVAAVDPSPRFVDELQRRLPEVDVRLAAAESLPWDDASFDAVLAQLVVSFMRDAPGSVAEMRRVLRPGGVVALCMWDLERMEMLRSIVVAGPTREYVDSLDDERRAAFREQLHREVGEPAAAFTLSAVAWGVRGRV